MDSLSAVAGQWKQRCHVVLAVYVHPDLHDEYIVRHDDFFRKAVHHALKEPASAFGSAGPAFAGHWSQWLASLTILNLPLSITRELVARAEQQKDGFLVMPREVNAYFEHTRATMPDGRSPPTVTHCMGLVPRAWLHRYVPVTEAWGGLSITDMFKRSCLLDESRFRGADPFAEARFDIGNYQRYLISHEFGHLLGMGHPCENFAKLLQTFTRHLSRAAAANGPLTLRQQLQLWDAVAAHPATATASTDSRGARSSHANSTTFSAAAAHPQTELYGPVMHQHTASALESMTPMSVPSVLDMIVQDAESIGRMLAQMEALYS
jgi:hypothetical protein